MSIGTYIAVYFIFWWITLFIALPFAGKSQAESGEVTLGTVPSAPAHPKLWKVIGINTAISAAIFAIFVIAIEVFGLTFEQVQSLFWNAR